MVREHSQKTNPHIVTNYLCPAIYILDMLDLKNVVLPEMAKCANMSFKSSQWITFYLSHMVVWNPKEQKTYMQIKFESHLQEVEWQTTRIEATATTSQGEDFLTPLRLIANQAKIRIVVKKRLSGRL